MNDSSGRQQPANKSNTGIKRRLNARKSIKTDDILKLSPVTRSTWHVGVPNLALSLRLFRCTQYGSLAGYRHRRYALLRLAMCSTFGLRAYTRRTTDFMTQTDAPIEPFRLRFHCCDSVISPWHETNQLFGTADFKLHFTQAITQVLS